MTGKCEAPKCPTCGELLEELSTNEPEFYAFDEETGDYIKDRGCGTPDITCNNCGADVCSVISLLRLKDMSTW